MKVFIKGLNVCPHRRQNLYHYQCFVKNAGHTLVDDPFQSEVVLVWTCAFRQDVIENSLTQLCRYQSEYSADVLALGCFPDIDREMLTSHFAGIVVPWKEEGNFLESYFSAKPGLFENSRPVFSESRLCLNAAQYREDNPGHDALFADEFFKLMISEGCPYECTYCTEKLAFPPMRSFSEEFLVEAMRGACLGDPPYRVILIGDCLGQYGQDIGTSLPQLVRGLREAYPETVYALQNLHPIDFIRFKEAFVSLIREGAICHLNLPVQSASNNVLSQMKRQYTRSDLDVLFSELRDLSFTDYDTHIIVGFPGETEKDFEETLSFLDEHKPRYVLVSKYYDAPNSPASRMEGKVEDSVVFQRMERMRGLLIRNKTVHNIDGAGVMQDRLARINQKCDSVV